GRLMQEPDADRDAPEHSDSPVIRAIAAVYWPVMAAIYLAWSFLTGDWEISWVIWPVAGVLYAGLSSLNVALRREDPSAERHTRRRSTAWARAGIRNTGCPPSPSGSERHSMQLTQPSNSVPSSAICRRRM